MNYGYTDPEESAVPIVLEKEDRDERYCVRLYHHVASAVDLSNRDVLEVGCGRGGGASYLARYLKPNMMVGVDIADRAIDFCRHVHHAERLAFLKGDAENLTFPDGSFDVVINVESSFCYGDMARFLSEVARVLRPCSHFLFADLRLAHEVEGLAADLERSAFAILKSDDITRRVRRALELDHERRVGGANGNIPPFLRGIVNTFVGAPGTRIPNLLETGELVYLNFVMQKQSRDGRNPSRYRLSKRSPRRHAEANEASIPLCMGNPL